MKLEQTLEGIQKYRERLHAEDLWSAPASLSECMAKLATYGSYLADHIAGLHKNATESEILAFKAARKRGLTAADSEREAKQMSLQPREDYENAKLVHKSTSDLTNVIQSRLKVLAEEARGNQ